MLAITDRESNIALFSSFFETESFLVVQTGLKLQVILMSQPP